MAWVNLNDVYVNKTGGTITGDLTVNGAIKVNDGKGSGGTYNVANEITTLRDSVSQTSNKIAGVAWTKIYTDNSNDGYCAYAKFGPIVVVNCDYLSISTKTIKTLGTLPTGCRPKKSVLGMAYARGENSCGQITVASDGKVQAYYSSSSSGYFGGTVVFAVS